MPDKVVHETFPRTGTRITRPSGAGRAFLEWEMRTGGTLEIKDIVVDGRRKGTGRALVRELVTSMGPVPLTVYAVTRLSNEIARAFWAAVGFREAARIEHFYQDGPEPETGVLFCLEVNRGAGSGKTPL